MKPLVLVSLPLICAGVAACGGNGGNPDPTLTADHLSLEATPEPDTYPLICVQGVGIDPQTEFAALQKIEEAMEDVGYGNKPSGMPNSVLGCPLPVTYDVHARRATGGARSYASEAEVSGFDLHVYVYPDPSLRGQPERYTVEAYLCYGDDCRQVEKGLYLAPSDICYRDLLLLALRQALVGLQRGEPGPQFVSPSPYFDAFGETRSPTQTPAPACF